MLNEYEADRDRNPHGKPCSRVIPATGLILIDTELRKHIFFLLYLDCITKLGEQIFLEGQLGYRENE